MVARPGRLALGVVAVLTAGWVLTGCSGDGEPDAAASASAPSSVSGAPSPSASATPSLPTVGEAYRAARTTALSAESGHVVGTQTREGRTLQIDVEGHASGSNQTAFISTPEGGTSEVRTVGADHWLGGDEAFWVEQTGDPAAGAGMVGKYVAISESDATELGTFTLRSVLAEVFAIPEIAALETETSPVVEAEVDGRAVHVLGTEGGARLWVLADGSGTLLRAVGPQSAPADLEFTDWGRARTFSAPAASEVVEG